MVVHHHRFHGSAAMRGFKKNKMFKFIKRLFCLHLVKENNKCIKCGIQFGVPHFSMPMPVEHKFHYINETRRIRQHYDGEFWKYEYQELQSEKWITVAHQCGEWVGSHKPVFKNIDELIEQFEYQLSNKNRRGEPLIK